jgi:2-polyprenyl-3-methyl-5-hydroxy-6-metoxy-1,4-benzoquinol methylase
LTRRAPWFYVPDACALDRFAAPDLMLLVTGNADATQWAASRRLAVEDIQGQLKALDIQLGRDAKILDLGCGCGRLLAGWEGLLPDTAILHGVDINPQLVAFCRDNIPFASVSCCNYDPPLSFDRAKFDLVYCASVFTHVTLPACLRWAAELARVVKPGGTLMISYHGEYYIDTLRGLAADGEKRLGAMATICSCTARKSKHFGDRIIMRRS